MSPFHWSFAPHILPWGVSDNRAEIGRSYSRRFRVCLSILEAHFHILSNEGHDQELLAVFRAFSLRYMQLKHISLFKIEPTYKQ